MLTRLRIQGFKSWADTGDIKLGKFTGFFGPNSSGKTSLLQFLLMLKQTVESSDRSRVLHTGDANSYVDLGTFYDIIHKHQEPGRLVFELGWDDYRAEKLLSSIRFTAAISQAAHNILVDEFSYMDEQGQQVGFRIKAAKNFMFGIHDHTGHFAEVEITPPEPGSIYFNRHSPQQLIPGKFFRFPLISEISDEYSFALQGAPYWLESQLLAVYYLGPLREYPGRLYPWAGGRPADVGRRGEHTMEALLASEVEYDGQLSNPETNSAHTLTQHVAYWLKRLGLIHSFELRPIAPNRKEYEVRIKQSPTSIDVALTDVGFGVSQVLPVLTLCFYAPRGSTILFEQPEIHLHPAVQAGLADVFLDAIKQRGVQIILESHSEHLLHRLQLRIAEQETTNEDVQLYFAQAADGESKLTGLDLDEYGNIRNWPKGFFGDDIGDLIKMTQVALKRKLAQAGQ